MFKLSYNEQKILIELMRKGKFAIMGQRYNNMTEEEARKNWQETAEFDTMLQSVIDKVEKSLIAQNWKVINNNISRSKKEWQGKDNITA